MKAILRMISLIIYCVICGFIVSGQSVFGQTMTIKDYMFSGKNAFNESDYYKAIESYNAVLHFNNRYADAYLGLAEAYFFSADYEDALFHLDQYQRYATSIEARVLRGRTLAGLGKKEEAWKILSVVLSEQPNNIDAQFGLAEVKLLDGNYNQAILDFENLLSRVSDNRRALLSLLLLYEKVGRLDEAENVLRDALFYNPQDPLTLYIVGEYYQRRHDWIKALEHYNTVSLLQKNFPGINLRRAESFFKLGEYTKSEEILEDLIKRDKRRNISVWAMLAEVFVLQGKHAEAIHAYEEILRLDPNNQMARLSVENFVRRNFSEMSDVRKHYAQARFLKGKRYEKSFLYEKAQHEYRLSLLIYPDDTQTRYSYARLQKLMGNYHTYVNQLEVIKNMENVSQRVLDELEMEKYREVKSVSKDWNISYGQVGTPIKILLTTNSDNNNLPFQIEEHLHDVFYTHLDRYTRFEIINVGSISSFEQAWTEARQNNVDFFIVMQYMDSGNSFYGSFSIYLTSTSALVEQYGVKRINLDKIESVFSTLSLKVHNILPFKATLLERRESLGIASLGKIHGIGVGDQFIVIKRENSYFKSRVPYYDYREEYVLGVMKIVRVDEFVSEGKILSKESPDIIKNGDELYLVKNSQVSGQGASSLTGIPEGFLLIH